MKVSDIFRQKLDDIQSRIPIKLNMEVPEDNFQKYLDNSNKPALDKSGVDHSNDLQRAKLSKSMSKAYIPFNKAELMNKINNSIEASANRYKLDPNLIRAVMKQESAFNPYSLSTTGAQGLMQLMPDTADALGVDDPWNIEKNIDGGSQYLKEQLDTFGDIRLALAAYNAGSNSVLKYKGIPPYDETRDYIVKVLKYLDEYSLLT